MSTGPSAEELERARDAWLVAVRHAPALSKFIGSQGWDGQECALVCLLVAALQVEANGATVEEAHAALTEAMRLADTELLR